jgi:glycosyltransferase involved in cell wall biosynthesis
MEGENVRKKLLFISSKKIYPLTRGDRIRVFNTLKILSEEYDIDLLFLTNEKTNDEDLIEIQKYCKNIKEFCFPNIAYILNVLFGLIKNKRPLQVNYFYFEKVQKWIDKRINEYDIVFCNHVRTTEYVKKYNSLTKVVDFVDAISMNYITAQKGAKLLWKYIYKIESKRLINYEVEISKKFDRNIIISETDKNHIVKHGGKNDFTVISNFVKNFDEVKVNSVSENSLSFIGAMNYEPNVSAMVYFCREVLPELKIKKPDLEMEIIGGFVSKEVERLSEIDGVNVRGFVEKPEIIIKNTCLFVAPMISGAGVQNKILEAMKLGKCVITTKIGAQGLPNLDGNEIIIAEDKKDMVDQILYYLDETNKYKRDKIGENAHKYILKYFSYEGVRKQMIEALMVKSSKSAS